MSGIFDSAIFDSVIFDTGEEDDRARRALEHYRLGWARALRRRMEDEDEAWLVLQR